MPLFSVDEAKCRRDGICAEVCPVGIIELKDRDSLPQPKPGMAKMCLSCGHCVAVCPHAAISLAVMKAEDCGTIDGTMLPGAPAMEQIIRRRRSIRRYTDEPVSREIIDQLIGMARYAPTGTNTQQVAWLAVTEPATVRRYAGHVADWMRELIRQKHPMVAYGLERIVAAWDAGYDGILRGAPALIAAHAPKAYPIAQTDCTIALTTLDLAAPSLGLGTCWAGFFAFAATTWPPLLDELGLPEGHGLFGALMLGYPKYPYQRFPTRKPPRIDWL